MHKKKVDVHETKKIPLKTPHLFVGLAGPGAVGTIAAQHMITQLEMEEIAHVCSRLLPPVTVFFDGLIRRPFRIYSNQKGNYAIAISEVPNPTNVSYYIARGLADWAVDKKVKDVVIMDGIPRETQPNKRIIYGAAEPDILNRLGDYEIQPLKRGLITGLRAALMNECLTLKLNGMILLTPATIRIPDPEAASSLIQKINEIYDLNVDLKPLLSQATEIQDKLKEITEKYQELKTPKSRPRDEFLA